MEHRPLYAAMNKYGVQNFSIELIEKTDNPEEREKFWIEYYGSFKNGYNATIGGDGKKYIDYDIVISTYQELKSIVKTANVLNISKNSVHNILTAKNINIYSSSEINSKQFGKMIKMYSLNDEYIQTFPSAAEAARYLINNNKTKCKFTTIRYHISEVCNLKRKTAAGYKWKYV